MISNQKLKIAVLGQKGSKKSRLLQNFLSYCTPDSLNFLNTYCMIGILSQKQDLFHYKILDLNLNKSSKIISNTFFPEIHATLYISSETEYNLKENLQNSEKILIHLLHAKAFKLIVTYCNSFEPTTAPSEILSSHFSFLVTEDDPVTILNLFEWMIFKLTETYEINKLNRGIILERREETSEECC
jgi:hypothetical protein